MDRKRADELAGKFSSRLLDMAGPMTSVFTKATDDPHMALGLTTDCFIRILSILTVRQMENIVGQPFPDDESLRIYNQNHDVFFKTVSKLIADEMAARGEDYTEVQIDRAEPS